jgi:hypothetical protein
LKNKTVILRQNTDPISSLIFKSRKTFWQIWLILVYRMNLNEKINKWHKKAMKLVRWVLKLIKVTHVFWSKIGHLVTFLLFLRKTHYKNVKFWSIGAYVCVLDPKDQFSWPKNGFYRVQEIVFSKEKSCHIYPRMKFLEQKLRIFTSPSACYDGN